MNDSLEILALLEQYKITFAEDLAITERFINLIKNSEDCFLRTNLNNHITASAFIIDQESHSKALFIYHKKLQRWLQPGGHADGDKNLLSVALREAREETALQSVTTITDKIFDLDIHQIPARNETPEHLHFDVRFIFAASIKEAVCSNSESEGIQWFNLQDVNLNLFDSSIVKMSNKIPSFLK